MFDYILQYNTKKYSNILQVKMFQCILYADSMHNYNVLSFHENNVKKKKRKGWTSSC